MSETCGASMETPDGTGLCCRQPKHGSARHVGWYEGSKCEWDDVCSRCDPHCQGVPDAPCREHARISELEALLARIFDWDCEAGAAGLPVGLSSALAGALYGHEVKP